MKSKVILFCVLLYCSKFVDSSPHSEEQVRQRAFQSTNWPVNKYESGQYVDTNFAQTQNGNILKNVGLQLEDNQNYYANQRRRDFENHGYNKNPTSSLLGKETLVNYGPSVEGRRLDSYPTRGQSYQPRPSQDGLDNSQYRFQKWGLQNQYISSAPSAEVVPDNERPLVRSVQEPYRAPVQYIKPQSIPPLNRRHHLADRPYPYPREPYQYSMKDNIELPDLISAKYVPNSASFSGLRESVPNDNNSNGYAIDSETSEGLSAPESGSIYNRAADGITSDALLEQLGNIRYEVNQKSRVDSSNTADVNTYEDSSQEVSAAENYETDSRPSRLLPINIKDEAPVVIRNVLSERPLVRRYANNYRPDSSWNNFARDSFYNDASVTKTNTFEVKTENINNYEPELNNNNNKLTKFARDSSYNDASVAKTNTFEIKTENVNNYESELNNNNNKLSNFARDSSYNEASVAKTNTFEIKTENINNDKSELNNNNNKLSNFARDSSYNEASVAKTNTFEIKTENVNNYEAELVPKNPSPINTYSDAAPSPIDTILNPGYKNNEALPQYGSTTPAPLEDTNSQQNFYHQLTSGIHKYDLKNIATHPKIKNLLAVNNKPYVLIHANGTVEYFDKFDLDSPSNSKYHLIHTKNTPLDKTLDEGDKVSRSHSPTFIPTNIATTPSPYPIEWADDDSSYVSQPAYHKKPQLSPLYRKQQDNDNYSEPSHPHADLSTDDNDDAKAWAPYLTQQDDGGNPKPLALKENQSSVDDDSKPWPENVNQPDNGSYPKPLVPKENQSLNSDDSTPRSTDRKITGNSNNNKPLVSKKIQSSDDDKSKPWSESINQPDDDRTPKPLTLKNSITSNPGPNSNHHKPLGSKENQSSGDDDLKYLPSNVKQSNDNNTPKLQAPKTNQSPNDDDSETLTSNLNQPDNGNNHKPQSPKGHQSPNDDDSKPSASDLNKPNIANDHKSQSPKEHQSPNDDVSKPSTSDLNKQNNANDRKPQSPKENQSPNDDDSKSLSSDLNKPNNANDHKSQSPKEHQSPNDDVSKPSASNLNKPKPNNGNDHNSQSPKEHQSSNDDDSKSSSSDLNKPSNGNDHKTQSPKEDQSPNDEDSKPSASDLTKRNNGNDHKPQSLKEDQSPNDDDSKPSASDLTKPNNGNDHKPQSPKEDQSPNYDDSKSSSSDLNKPNNGNDHKTQSPKEDQSPNDEDSKPSASDLTKRNNGNDHKPQSPKENQSPNDDDSKSSSSDLNKPNNGNDHKTQSPKEDQSPNDEDSKPSASDLTKRNNGNDHKPQSPKEDQSPNDDDSKSSSSDLNKPNNGNDHKTQSPKEDQSPNDEDSKPSASDLTKRNNGNDHKPQSPKEDQSPNDDDSKLSSSDLNKPNNGNDYKSQSPKGDQSPKDVSKPSASDLNKQNNGNDHNSQSPNEHESPNGDDSTPLSTNENAPVDDKDSKSSHLGSSNIDDNRTSTTLSPNVVHRYPSLIPRIYNKPRNKHHIIKSTTASPDVTTPYTYSTTEDEIITISPIELATDNVSDVPPVTTRRPIKTHRKLHTVKNTSQKDDAQEDSTSSSTDNSISDKTQTYSSPKESQSTSASQNTNTSDDKIITETVTSKNDKSIDNQINNGNNDTKTAIYNSLTNTDVPAESDDYSPVTTAPSIQIDVDTGDTTTPGDNSLESEQSETDIKITINTIDDSEDDIITVSIEVSESADDADSSSDDKSLVIKVDTNDSNDDGSKTLNTDDCQKNPTNNDDNTNKNIEIDMSNIQGEPTMWIRTTNQDFIDKLASKNETQFDVIYFFNIKSQPTIEREKVTTIHCNGTVVIEVKETSYAHQDDPTPTIVKTTKIMQIEDYEP